MKKLEEYMSTPEFDARMDESIKKMVEEAEIKEKKDMDFFESNKFKEILNNIVNSKEEVVSSNGWQYQCNYDFITEDDFYSLFESVLCKLSKEIIEDEDADFSTSYVMYRGLEFSVMNGQGSVLRIKKTPQTKTFIIAEKLEGF